MNRCSECKNSDVSVINTLCRTCFPKEDKAEFDALMGGTLESMKPVRNYTDNPSMFDNAIKTNVDLI